MADMTLERLGQPGDDDAGPDATSAATGPAPAGASSGRRVAPAAAADPSAGATDPRAVRVSVGPGSRVGEEPAIVVAPLPEPIEPIRHSLAGRGPLGGTVGDGVVDAAVHDAAARHRVGAGPTASPGAAAGRDAADRLVDPVGASTAAVDQLAVDAEPPEFASLLVDDEPVAARFVRRGPRRAELAIGQGGGTSRHRLVLVDDPTIGQDGRSRREIVVDGWRIEVEVEPERRAALRERARRGHEAAAHGGPTEVRAIIPGRVVSLSVAAGDPVAAGQQILVVEAMKMQNELRAPRDGTIRKVAVGPGVTIEVGDLLLVIE